VLRAIQCSANQPACPASQTAGACPVAAGAGAACGDRGFVGRQQAQCVVARVDERERQPVAPCLAHGGRIDIVSGGFLHAASCVQNPIIGGAAGRSDAEKPRA
jgi:hypothetical protein